MTEFMWNEIDPREEGKVRTSMHVSILIMPVFHGAAERAETQT